MEVVADFALGDMRNSFALSLYAFTEEGSGGWK